jgi:hypothetical protein
VEVKLFGTAVGQKQTGEDGSHRVGCHTAVWKERRNQHIMISKQQLKVYDESNRIIFNKQHVMFQTSKQNCF